MQFVPDLLQRTSSLFLSMPHASAGCGNSLQALPVYLVCLVFWLNETKQMNQINQINKTNQINPRSATPV
jgi:hypothetical protein